MKKIVNNVSYLSTFITLCVFGGSNLVYAKSHCKASNSVFSCQTKKGKTINVCKSPKAFMYSYGKGKTAELELKKSI